MNASFDVAAYSSTFAAVQAKLDNLHTTQAAILEKERLVKACTGGEGEDKRHPSGT